MSDQAGGTAFGPYRVIDQDARAVRDQSLALEDFGNYGIPSDFSEIPRGQVWVDGGLAGDERALAIGEALMRLRLERAGEDTDQAYRIALRATTARRRRLARRAGLVPDDVRVAEIGQHDGLAVWLVDGPVIRDLYDADFIEGGHDLVYPYIAAGQVWVDRAVPAGERAFIVAHEAAERRLMAAGSAYGPAHERASLIEWRLRELAGEAS